MRLLHAGQPATAATLVLSSWDHFVLRHQKPGNLVVHFISMLMFYGGPLLAVWRWDWRWFVPFFLSGILGAIGHYAFGDGGVRVRETTSSPVVPLYVPWMFIRIACRRYHEDTARARRSYQRALDASRPTAEVTAAML